MKKNFVERCFLKVFGPGFVFAKYLEEVVLAD